MGRFKIALSFSGENREIVCEIAKGLASIYGESSILYDRFHRAEFARPNLDLHLQTLYRDESELIVVFISDSYNERAWCGLEWRAIRDLLNAKTNDDRIMFIKCGKGAIDGVFGTIDGYIDTVEVAVSDIIDDIIKRHSLLENMDLYSYLNYKEQEYASEIKIVINGSVQSFIGKVIDMKHWVNHGSIVSTSAGSLMLKIKCNDFTKFVQPRDKFILSKSVWSIIGIDDTDSRAITVTCEKELIGPNDDMVNKIANKNHLDAL